jgi:hypothetical protein
MRMIMSAKFPIEPFNTHVRKGTIEALMKKLLEATKPEAAYFSSMDGRRGGVLIVDLPGASDIPRFAEPWFLALHAEISFQPCMTPEDLGKAGLNSLASGW